MTPGENLAALGFCAATALNDRRQLHSARLAGNLRYRSGQGVNKTGNGGTDLTIEHTTLVAQLTALELLSSVKASFDDLSRVEGVVGIFRVYVCPLPIFLERPTNLP